MVLWIFLFHLLHLALCYQEDLSDDLKWCLPDCNSSIYCFGEILHDVQMSSLFEDGTTFVQKRLRFPEPVIVERYKLLKKQENGSVSVDKLKNFVDENFGEDTSTHAALSKKDFPDYRTHPSILNKTNVEVYKTWLQFLNDNWIKLGTRMSENVKKNPFLHSFLYVPNVYVRAGGRFKEMYYWDSHWIIRGLLLSDMYDTARGMIENIIELVRRYEHMPNGNRIYYITRSQPPLLLRMAADYQFFTKNDSFIKANLKYFDKEFKWWYHHRSMLVFKHKKSYRVFRYKSISCTPRPESYKKDFELLENVTTNSHMVKIFTGIRSAAESGWDFSSRHMRYGKHNRNGTLGLTDMAPQHMVYVDINSIMYYNARTLEKWHDMFDADKSEAQGYKKIADDLLEAIDELLWNKKVGVWQDYDLFSGQHRDNFYLSNFAPLWNDAFVREKTKRTEYVKGVIEYLQANKIIGSDFQPKYHCIPTSMNNLTGEQWDFPNCWAPLQALLINGLKKNTDVHPKAEEIALGLSQKWIDTTYEGFQNGGKMYEKYSAVEKGSTGAGGEYEPQEGFGWTNGVCMEIFYLWGDKIRGPSGSVPESK